MITIIKPSTALIIFCNVLIFMLCQILLFWYVISKAVENIIIDKSSIVRDIISNSTVLQHQLTNYIKSTEYSIIYNQSIIDKSKRNEFNINLTFQWMMSPFILVISVLSLAILYTMYVHMYSTNNTLKLDRTDILVLTTVFLSFLTEIIVIYVLIMRYVYISDMEIIIFIINSKMINSVNFLPTYSPSIDFG